jgi:hypothetical protein
VTSQSVTTKEELIATKERVMNPAKGVRFTPRKKLRFSSDPSWEYAEEDILQPIAEVPKQKRYESGIVRLGEVINDLRSLALQLMSLVV